MSFNWQRKVLGGALLTVLATLSCVEIQASESSEDMETVGVVLLMRHGLRSPTKSNIELSAYSTKDWPQWSVAPGELTPRGAVLVTHMGEYFKAHYAEQGLFPVASCPATGAISIVADNADQRTRASGTFLASGLGPACNVVPVQQTPADSADPLFHSTTADLCPVDMQKARASIVQQADGDLEASIARFKAPMASMQAILDFHGKSGCIDAGGNCGLDGLHTKIKIDGAGGDVKFDGALPIASTVGEIFLLEYGDGMSASDIGWGQAATPEALEGPLSLHNLQSHLLGRASYVAARRGSALASAMLQSLRELQSADTEGKHGQRAKFVAYVGHDTNLNSIAGMLGLDWEIPGQPDQTPPAGALAFELMRGENSHRYVVRAVLYAPTLNQLRNLDQLGAQLPPAQVTLKVPACSKDPTSLSDFACFSKLVDRALDKECIQQIAAHRK